MKLRFDLVKGADVGPYADDLRALEIPTSGPAGETYVGIARDGDRVVGAVSGVFHDVMLRARVAKALQVTRVAVAPDARGHEIARKVCGWTMRKLPFAWRFLYTAAVRGPEGDVVSRARGLHPAKLLSQTATLDVYDVDPVKLASLDTVSCLPVPFEDVCLRLSYDLGGADGMVVRDDGRVHLVVPPSRAQPSWPAYLRASGEAMLARGMKGRARFALDPRLKDNTGWLQRRGIKPALTCAVYAWDLTFRARSALWLHLPSSEIAAVTER